MRVIPNDDVQAAALNALMRRDRCDNVATVYDGHDYSQGLAALMRLFPRPRRSFNDDDSTIVLSVWQYLGSGYLNPGDVLLAAGVEASLRAAREALHDLRCGPPPGPTFAGRPHRGQPQ